MHLPSRSLPCLAAALLGFAAFTARAQQAAPATDTIALDKLVVQSVVSPTANSLADRQQIELQSPASSVINAIKYLPGVNLSQGDSFGGDDWSTRLTIRGFNENQLGFTLDGVASGFTGYAGGAKPNRYVDIENLSSVVVSQGAADIASASNQALGGTLAYFTDTPNEMPGTLLKYTLGSFDASRGFLRVDTGKFANGTSNAFLSFSTEQNENWVRHYVGGGAEALTKRIHADAKDVSQFGKVKVTVYASFDKVDPEINYQGVSLQSFAQNPRNDNLTFQFTGDPNTDQNFAPTWTTIRTNSLVYAKLELPLSDTVQVSFQPYWAHQNGKGEFLPPYQIRRTDLGGNPASLGNYSAPGTATTVLFANASGSDIPPYNPATGTAAANPYDISTYTWLTPAQQAAAHAISTARFSRYQNDRYGDNLAFDWNLMQNNDLRFGMWNEDQERLRHRTWHAVTNPLVSPDYNATPYLDQFFWNYRTTTNMFYVQDQYKLDNYTFTAGLKYFQVKVKASESLLLPTGAPNFSASLNSNSQVLPSIGAQYKIDTASELFASITSNFSAVQDAILEAGASGVDISKVKPEKATNFDFGYRYASKNLAFSATGFYIKYTDKIVSLSGLAAKDYSNASSGVYVNIGGTEAYGTELAARYRLTSQLSLLGSFSYTHATYSSDTPDGTITSGKKVVDTPDIIASYGLLYTAGEFSGGLNGKTTGKRYGTYSNDNWAGAYTVFDFNLDYTHRFAGNNIIKSVSADFTVTNLFDKDYLGNVSTNDQGYVKNDPTGTIMLYTIGAPRTYTLSVSLGF